MILSSLNRSAVLGAVVIGVVASGLVAERVSAQDVSHLSPQEKIEGFIQHVVKVARIDPARYSALVLEYEIGRALDELRAIEHEAHAAEGETTCCAHEDLAYSGDDFIAGALKEIYPEYRKLVELLESDPAAAREKAREIERGNDPYLTAYAALAGVQLDFTAAKRSEGNGAEAYLRIVEKCERIVANHRLYLVPDYEASELIAKCFGALGRPLFELTQTMIVLTDFQHMPDARKAELKGRAEELSKQVGAPLGKVGNWMGGVERLLEKEVTGLDPTQAEETKILAALDKLIELQEAIEKNACKSCGGSNCQGACRGGNAGGNRSNSPARVSRLVTAEGKVLLHGVSRGDPGSIWGQLRDRDGARALQSYSGQLPPRYQRLLEQYFEDLSRTER